METLLENYNEFIGEASKHKFTTNKDINLLIISFLKFWENKIGLKRDEVKIQITKTPKNLGGYIKIGSGGYTNGLVLKINKDFGLRIQLNYIAHELVHAKQFIDKRLQFDGDYIKWLGKDFISTKDYMKLISSVKKSPKRLVEYKELPWEVEAYKANDNALSMFKKSSDFKELQDNANEVQMLYIESVFY